MSAAIIRALEQQAAALREEAAVIAVHGTDAAAPERTAGLLTVIASEFERVAHKAQGTGPESSQGVQVGDGNSQVSRWD